MEDYDIAYYYEQLNRLIDIVEKDTSNTEELGKIEEYFKKVMDAITMILITKKDRYYGCLLMNFQFRIDFYSNSIACVSIDEFPFLMTVNPLLLGRYSLKQIVYIIAHELEHIVLDHPAQMARGGGYRDAIKNIKLNYSMDASINDRLNFEIETYELGILSNPGDNVTSETISMMCGYSLDKMKSYDYYFDYIPNPKITTIPIIANREPSIVTTKNRKNGVVLKQWSECNDADELHEVVKDMVEKSLDSLNDEERGMLPSYQKTAIEKLLEPAKITWKNVLKRYVGTVPSSMKKTRTRLSRRQPERYDISGQIEERSVKIIVAIDTSGSMTNKMIENAFVEIIDIVKNIKHEITVIECDYKINKIYKATSVSDLKLEVGGRGGTSYCPVIEHINKNRYYNDALLIYFTDGFGDTYIPKPRTRYNLWVVIGNKADISLREPYGQVMALD